MWNSSWKTDHSILERFWSKVLKGPHCWLWNAGKFPNGYGSFSVEGKTIAAHVFSYQLHYGGIVERNRVVKHSCDNVWCVNPAHLILSTQLDNVLDAVSQGAHSFRQDKLSKFRGVCWDRKWWVARFYHQGRRVHLGFFDTEVEAAKAYDDYAFKILGSRACLNRSFPDLACKMLHTL